MLEKVTHIAEQAATNVSRRGFLGRFGCGAAGAAAALGGLLALSNVAQAGRKCRLCCIYDCSDGDDRRDTIERCFNGTSCPKKHGRHCFLFSACVGPCPCL